MWIGFLIDLKSRLGGPGGGVSTGDRPERNQKCVTHVAGQKVLAMSPVAHPVSPRRVFGPGAARLFSLLLRHRHSLRSHVHTCGRGYRRAPENTQFLVYN
jgi:hypothetical protein